MYTFRKWKYEHTFCWINYISFRKHKWVFVWTTKRCIFQCNKSFSSLQNVDHFKLVPNLLPFSATIFTLRSPNKNQRVVEMLSLRFVFCLNDGRHFTIFENQQKHHHQCTIITFDLMTSSCFSGAFFPLYILFVLVPSQTTTNFRVISWFTKGNDFQFSFISGSIPEWLYCSFFMRTSSEPQQYCCVIAKTIPNQNALLAKLEIAKCFDFAHPKNLEREREIRIRKLCAPIWLVRSFTK